MESITQIYLMFAMENKNHFMGSLGDLRRTHAKENWIW
jgi:hypothetical protein